MAAERRSAAAPASVGTAPGPVRLLPLREDTWLLAVDGSRGADSAARYVARTAKALGVGAIRLVNARLPSVGAERTSVARQRAEAMADARRTTASAQRILDFAGLKYRLEAPVGDDPAAMIVGASENADVTEVIMGTRGVSMLSSITLGSVAYKVLHMARRSITLVPDRARAAGRGGGRNPLVMLLAVDGSGAANRAVQYAARQAAANSAARVLLLNVQPRIVSQNVRRFVSRAQIEMYAQQEAAAAMRAAERILGKAGVRYERRVSRGDVVETILETATESDCGRIVLGTRGRGAAKSLLLGSVAYGVVHHADMPVTVVKQALPAPVLLPGPAARR
jgi:nucleotide-binding universal stress UspA family protein